MLSCSKNLEFIQIDNGKMMMVEVWPVFLYVKVKTRELYTSKWMNPVVWQEILELVSEISANYNESSISSKDFRMQTKFGSTIAIGYRFSERNGCACSCCFPHNFEPAIELFKDVKPEICPHSIVVCAYPLTTLLYGAKITSRLCTTKQIKDNLSKTLFCDEEYIPSSGSSTGLLRSSTTINSESNQQLRSSSPKFKKLKKSIFDTGSESSILLNNRSPKRNSRRQTLLDKDILDFTGSSIRIASGSSIRKSAKKNKISKLIFKTASMKHMNTSTSPVSRMNNTDSSRSASPVLHSKRKCLRSSVSSEITFDSDSKKKSKIQRKQNLGSMKTKNQRLSRNKPSHSTDSSSAVPYSQSDWDTVSPFTTQPTPSMARLSSNSRSSGGSLPDVDISRNNLQDLQNEIEYLSGYEVKSTKKKDVKLNCNLVTNKKRVQRKRKSKTKLKESNVNETESEPETKRLKRSTTKRTKPETSSLFSITPSQSSDDDKFSSVERKSMCKKSRSSSRASSFTPSQRLKSDEEKDADDSNSVLKKQMNFLQEPQQRYESAFFQQVKDEFAKMKMEDFKNHMVQCFPYLKRVIYREEVLKRDILFTGGPNAPRVITGAEFVGIFDDDFYEEILEVVNEEFTSIIDEADRCVPSLYYCGCVLLPEILKKILLSFDFIRESGIHTDTQCEQFFEALSLNC